MINFKEMNLSAEIHKEVDELEIGFVFQPIYRLSDMYLVGYEALMRPKNRSPLELIEEYRQRDELHKIELATVFGAWQAYRERSYDTLLSINSFPEECLTDKEEICFHNLFPESQMRLIVEILEYTKLDLEKWDIKHNQLKKRQVRTVIDDFGTGNNTEIDIVDLYSSIMIKLDRKLISGIDSNEELQRIVVEYIKEFHDRNILVLAECVETEAELNYLISAGVDFAQGYYLGRPA